MKTTLTSFRRALFTAAFVFLHSSFVIAQGGPLTPSGPPAPTMRSLQEIWDKADGIEQLDQSIWFKTDLIQQQMANLQARVTSLETQNQNLTNLLLSIGQTTGAMPWQLMAVDNPGIGGTYNSLAFTPGGQPAICYLDDTFGHLKYAVFDGSNWTRSNVAGRGSYSSLAFTPGGQPAISYFDETNGDLKYAIFNGSTWALDTVDYTGVIDDETSLAFGSSGEAAISYHSPAGLKCAFLTDFGWIIYEVDTTGFHSSLAFTTDGVPAISYQNDTGDLKYAFLFTGPSWTLTTVDSPGVVGEYSSLAFTPSGQPAISYFDGTNGDLKYAVFSGSAWKLTTVDSVGIVGTHTSLAFTPSGQPAISYCDGTNDTIKYAVRVPFAAP